VVHTVNVVQNADAPAARHLALVPTDRRARRRARTRQRILAAADALIAEHGIDGITMQRVADRLDCAVGTLYLYVSSKADLVTALQARAVDLLHASFSEAGEGWDSYLDEADLEPDLRALVRLCGFGAHWASAAVVLADEFRLQRSLLSEAPVDGATAATEVAKAVDRLLAHPTACVTGAQRAGALTRGDAGERALVWVAALNGVLLLDHLAPIDRHRFRAPHLARRVTEDLAGGWGAARADIEVADAHVQRLAALAPLAPPPSGPELG
jgi:AcrR family transcriptional regulator